MSGRTTPLGRQSIKRLQFKLFEQSDCQLGALVSNETNDEERCCHGISHFLTEEKFFRLAPWKTLPSESYMSCKAAPIFYGVENLFKPLGLYISSGNILCHIFIIIRMVLIFRWVTEFKVNEHHFVCEYSKRKWFVMVICKSDLTFKMLSPLICRILLASCYRNYTFLVQRIFS